MCCVCHHETARPEIWEKFHWERWLMVGSVDRWGGRLPDSGSKGVSGGRGGGGGGFSLTARHMEGYRLPPDGENGILNAYLRCYRWRSQRQRILYTAFWKAPLIFHQNCVYTRKQTKKEVCRLNPPCRLSLTRVHICSVLHFWSHFSHCCSLPTASPPRPAWRFVLSPFWGPPQLLLEEVCLQ